MRSAVGCRADTAVASVQAVKRSHSISRIIWVQAVLYNYCVDACSRPKTIVRLQGAWLVLVDRVAVQRSLQAMGPAFEAGCESK